MNVSNAAATMPGHRQRQCHVQERVTARCVQIAAGGDQVRVKSVDRYEQRKDRERQESVRHAEDDRQVGVHEDDRLARQPERLEERVHDPVVAQQDDPGVGADQVARPERKHHEDDQQHLVAPAVAADPVGDR
jgi:hypothetical protein